MPDIAPISLQIWDMKYRLKAADGAPLDATIEDSWRRVAGALAAPEAEPAAWAPRFEQALADFRFLPAGRILAGAGADRAVTLFNCFVMGEIPDDMTGIFEHLKEAALTMQQGGGIGYDFSTLRPKGAVVKGVGADASGPLSFMDVWDAMCRTIMSAGYRRGAMMATLRCDHPDIEAFIDAKREPGRLRMFNLSVLVSDALMDAVAADRAWELTFDGVIHGSVSARELWHKIMRATYAYAEPGVIFIDRINRRNPLVYAETIHATNPCVTADTWVHTADGPRQVLDLIDKPFAAVINGVPFDSGPEGFFATGRRPVLRLTTREGQALRLTANHRVRKVAKRTRNRVDYVWVEAGDLKPGDLIALHDHRDAVAWPGAYTRSEGYLMGLLVGDGTLKTDKAVLSVWPGAAVVNGDVASPGVGGVMDEALAAARTLPHRSDFQAHRSDFQAHRNDFQAHRNDFQAHRSDFQAHRSDFQGWVAVPGRGEYRLALGALKRLAGELGLRPGHKAVTGRIERASAAFYRGFLRGFFDADGSVQGTQVKGVSVRLAQSDLPRLEAVQRMLLRLGIVSTLYRERRPAGPRMMPDGKGGSRLYDCSADHELVISNDNVGRFASLIGFADHDKQARLDSLMAAYKRRPNRERFFARVEALIDDGEADVFDVRVPGINAFDGSGLVVHNCGEQPLPPYGACLLGSINLARLVEAPFEADAALDLETLDELTRTAVRMLDNAIDVSNFPLEAQAREARAKRRIGLGVTGLADALIMCGARYGSDASLALVDQWMHTLQRAAYLASSELAAEKGAFPLYDAAAYLATEAARGLDDDIREAIRTHGLRNALLTSVAPTGTISLLADNVSSGLEPVFSYSYTRNLLLPDGSQSVEEVSDYAYRLFRRLHGETAPLPAAFVDVEHLTPGDHLRIQAAVQTRVDSSISKTINVAEGIAFDDFKDIYHQAYAMGCKGCTTYRPNAVTGAVLKAPSDTKDDGRQAELPLKTQTPPEDQFEAGGVVYMTQPLSRPEELPGATYKVRWPESDHAMYITINDIIMDGRRRPFEMFVNSKNMEHYAWTVALTRMISAVFRRGGDVSFVVDELKAVFDPRGGQWVEGRYVPSILAAIGDVIERHMIDIGFMPAPDAKSPVAEALRKAAGDDTTDSRLPRCPKCSMPSLIHQEGCDLCTSCGYSKCA